jgi:hypothetical protein
MIAKCRREFEGEEMAKMDPKLNKYGSFERQNSTNPFAKTSSQQNVIILYTLEQ